MNSAQHQFFNMVVESAKDARAGLHDQAWILLGILMFGAIVVLGFLCVRLLQIGGSKSAALETAEGRREFELWLRGS